MSEELKPCPWCGSDEHLSIRATGSMTSDMPGRPYRVVCSHIDHDSVEGPVAYGKYEARIAWNTRHVPQTERVGGGEGEIVEIERKAKELFDLWRNDNRLVCDADSDGHSPMQQGDYFFCTGCGKTITTRQRKLIAEAKNPHQRAMLTIERIAPPPTEPSTGQGWRPIEPTNDVIRYVVRYGGWCRDCAEEEGVCPANGLPCDGVSARNAVRHVIGALNYGFHHGYLPLPAAPSQPLPGEME